jgi:hypothetical protein
MARRIAIIQGHPDASLRHYGHALADEYAKGVDDGATRYNKSKLLRLCDFSQSLGDVLILRHIPHAHSRPHS